jgi:hypothetical protein
MQDHKKQVRELTDAELDAVAAGEHRELPDLKALPAENSENSDDGLEIAQKRLNIHLH